jgi:hypothetical protein
MLGEDSFDLLANFKSLALEPAAPRETGLVEARQMEWNSSECRLSCEFKSIYTSRMDQLSSRLAVPGVVPIAQVSENNAKYCIAGIIKRLESRRVRAFEKEF